MVDEQSTAEAPELVDEAKLKDEVMTALANGDFDTAKKLTSQLAKGQKDKESAEVKAKQEALKGTTEKVKSRLVEVINKMREKGDLEGADHVKFLYVFDTNTQECSLVKSPQARTRSGAGAGTGRKFEDKTEDLLKEFGHLEFKDNLTYQQYYDLHTDGNKRYQVRMGLLREKGLLPKPGA